MGTDVKQNASGGCAAVQNKSVGDMSLLDLGKRIACDTPDNLRSSWSSFRNDMADAINWSKQAISGKISLGEIAEVASVTTLMVGMAFSGGGRGAPKSNLTVGKIAGTQEGAALLERVAERLENFAEVCGWQDFNDAPAVKTHMTRLFATLRPPKLGSSPYAGTSLDGLGEQIPQAIRFLGAKHASNPPGDPDAKTAVLWGMHTLSEALKDLVSYVNRSGTV